MENPLRMDDLRVPLFLETPKSFVGVFCIKPFFSAPFGWSKLHALPEVKVQKGGKTPTSLRSHRGDEIEDPTV